jgi:two-component system, OmpR family, sensor histidine kinase KdpD
MNPFGDERSKAAEEHRSRLKIFLGAAPGAGKTYRMLQSTQSRRHDGVNVVVGLIETHGGKIPKKNFVDLR